MTERVQKFLDLLLSKEYRKNRINNEGFDVTDKVNAEAYSMRDTIVLEEMLKAETPVFLEDDIFGFNRSLVYLPCYTDKDGKIITSGPGNNTPNYARIIGQGFDATLEEIAKYEKINTEGCSPLFYEAMRRSVLASIDIAERYRETAEKQGYTRIAEALKQVPRKPARTFYEACLFFKILIYTLRCSHATHLTIGRFDQYMLPYYEADIKNGVPREELFEILEMLFISINIDPDIYFGCQQGDNGQSMVLAGFDKNGNYLFNDLTDLCMQASLELNLIDPKINIRVGKNTPDWVYDYGTKLTKKGLGFPQYCNDDLIVPYMIGLGYDEDDAWNYTVAACWEVISPNNGYDIPNRAFFPFIRYVNEAIRENIQSVASFEELMAAVDKKLYEWVQIRTARYNGNNDLENRQCSECHMYLSLFVDGCIEKGLDETEGGAKYTNFGFLGGGISNAADSLAAVKKCVFEEKSITPDELVAALDADFVGYEEIQNKLLSAPKMGNNDDYVDELAGAIMDIAVKYIHGKPNCCYGGIWRIGTGSAHSYICASKEIPATADGRNAFAPFSCSFSPAITTKTEGPLSVLQSFTKHDLAKLCNGGPFTIELHDTVFRNEEGEKKVAQFVKAFIQLGGHQLQINSINRERLLEAKAHPEDYPNLIVRVWGWSGYFCELDTEYQDHIISRAEYLM